MIAFWFMGRIQNHPTNYNCDYMNHNLEPNKASKSANILNH